MQLEYCTKCACVPSLFSDADARRLDMEEGFPPTPSSEEANILKRQLQDGECYEGELCSDDSSWCHVRTTYCLSIYMTSCKQHVM